MCFFNLEQIVMNYRTLKRVHEGTDIADEYLVAAVSNAGGLGVLASGLLTAEQTRMRICALRSMTNKPFALNIAMFTDNTDELAALVVEEGIPIVATGGGNPERYLSAWKKAGIIVIPIIPTVRAAEKMEALGADLVVAEGMESGGHIGTQTTMALVPQVVNAVKIPVVAAGGIADRRGVAAAFALGAVAVQMGTRFVVANECRVHPAYKQTILAANGSDTVVTGAYLNNATRCIANNLTAKLLECERRRAPREEFEALGKGAFRRAVFEGDMKNGSVICGQGVGLVTREESVVEIMSDVMR